MLALVKLAREFGKGTLMINEIAESEKIPKRFLESIVERRLVTARRPAVTEYEVFPR